MFSAVGDFQYIGAASMIKTTLEKVVFQNKYLRVRNDDVEFGDAKAGQHIRIDVSPGSPDGVVILPRREDGSLLLVETFRYGVGRVELELPRGGREAGESVHAAALRELTEETGIGSDDVLGSRSIGQVQPDNAILSSRIHVVLVEVAQKARATPDLVEALRCDWYPYNDVGQRILSGRICDGYTQSAYLLHTLQNAK